MRFLLYNIKYGAGIGPRFHFPLPFAGYLKKTTCNLECILSFIESVKPDIIGLIEVDSGSFRSEMVSQADIIARQLGYSFVSESKYGSQPMIKRVPVLNKQGNALITNYPIVNYTFHYFREGFKRLVIEVKLKELTVFLVHLSLTFRKRQYQLERLHRIIRQAQGPVIVAGDFNVLWGSRELELFLAATGLKSADNEGKPSHPSRKPKRQLDFILHGPELKVLNFYIPPIHLSDHAPLVCDFDLGQSTAAHQS